MHANSFGVQYHVDLGKLTPCFEEELKLLFGSFKCVLCVRDLVVLVPVSTSLRSWIQAPLVSI